MNTPSGQLLRLGDTDLWYEDRGSPGAPLIVLLMGNGCGASFWPEPWLEQLVRGGRRVIRFDYRDTGRSSHIADFDRTPYSLDDLERDVLGLLAHLGLGQVHWAGLSMGGFLALRLATRHPGTVASLTSMMSTPDYAVLLHTFMGGEAPTSGLPPPRQDWLEALSKIPPGLPPLELSVESWRLANGSRAPFDAEYWRGLQRLAETRGDDALAGDHHRRACERITGKNQLEALRHVTAPCLFIQGSEDPIFVPAHAEAAARAAPAGKLRVIDGMGHALNPAFFEPLAQALLAHTGAVPRGP
ncbi:alpha/beta fold hydrolase [Stigmatella erecta]|uniref:Pimeloyl-ACP methyl ester carboxylesterase n=1 Tax=Stigmatella erecta TaxID=83460 RepID=A0A1I0DTD6_9BACT|nr:alpha/beta hydrolase [Stigmatella erecta]SET35876.1 Pimeloyl-ACP methyl ester carboxylesterase [Stigmatella erecta]